MKLNFYIALIERLINNPCAFILYGTEGLVAPTLGTGDISEVLRDVLFDHIVVHMGGSLASIFVWRWHAQSPVHVLD